MANLTTTPQIKANELRIGNWVMNTFGSTELGIEPKPMQIGQIDDHVALFYTQVEGKIYETTFLESHRVAPIPLTFDVMVAAGFKVRYKYKTVKEDYVETDEPFSYWLQVADNFGLKVKIFKNGRNAVTITCFSNVAIKTRDIWYLHDIQNLYFVLAGKELEIKLPSVPETN